MSDLGSKPVKQMLVLSFTGFGFPWSLGSIHSICLSALVTHRDGSVVSSLHCMNDPQPEGHMARRKMHLGQCSKPFDLGPKLVSVERALAAIRAGSRIYIGTGCAAPRTLLTRLEAMEPAPVDLEFVSFLTTSALPQMEGASHT